MLSIFNLPVYVFIYILRYLNIHDRIAFALTCRMFRQICVDEGVFRELDLSRRALSKTCRGTIDRFFRDRELTQHIRELNFSNLRVWNWQMDAHLIQEFIIPNCFHLEALHVLDCGLSFQRLLSILEEAPKLTALSWSLLDFTSEDIEFVVNDIESSEGICFNNIKHLCLEMNDSQLQIQIAKYLLLSCFRDVEDLEIRTWSINKKYFPGGSFPLAAVDWIVLGFPEPSVENQLQHLHSLTLVAVGDSQYAHYGQKLADFVLSVLRRNSSSTKWKKLWIPPSISISRFHADDLQSVEAIAANLGWSAIAVDEPNTFFERIGDHTVRSLQFYLPYRSIPFAEICEPISRVGGHSLKFLRLSAIFVTIHENVVLHSLFSNCLNITELDLLDCYFEKDICELLSELKHLAKVQLKQCAISSKYDENEVEISKPNFLTFVENCKNITHLDVRSCDNCHMQFSCRLTDDDLLALEKLRKLKFLTLYDIHGITEWTFLKKISKHCKFLSTFRISARLLSFNNSHMPILMETAKFLQHLAISVDVRVLDLEVFWDLLRHAKNLERFCINCRFKASINVPVAVETLKCLPRLCVLHLHCFSVANEEDFCDELIRMLEEKDSYYRFSFEIVIENRINMSKRRINTWISDETGCSLISNTALPLNIVELCDMTPILEVCRF